MTTTTTDQPAAADVRLVPVPTGAGVPLADRLLMHVGLALLLASSRHASRPAREPRAVRTAQEPRGDQRRPASAETARPFCGSTPSDARHARGVLRPGKRLRYVRVLAGTGRRRSMMNTITPIRRFRGAVLA
jgi:hypothetical protein